MARLAMPILLFALCVSRPALSAELSDPAFVLPGAFSEQTTVSDFEARFGKANVRILEAADNDGARGVVLFADDPTRRAYVAFHDAPALKGVQSIVVRDAGSRWRGKGGVHIGMSFAELQKVNGKPFGYSGFDDQLRAFAHAWSPSLSDEDGTLGNLDVSEGDHMYFGVEFGPRGDTKAIPADAYPHDENLVSDDPRYPKLGELFRVTEINATTSLDDEW